MATGHAQYTHDTLLELKDAGLVAASAAAQVGGSNKILDLGGAAGKQALQVDVACIGAHEPARLLCRARAAIQRRIEGAEFKRFQYAPTIRVTERCWDGRRVPVAHRFAE